MRGRKGEGGRERVRENQSCGVELHGFIPLDAPPPPPPPPGPPTVCGALRGSGAVSGIARPAPNTDERRRRRCMTLRQALPADSSCAASKCTRPRGVKKKGSGRGTRVKIGVKRMDGQMGGAGERETEWVNLRGKLRGNLDKVRQSKNTPRSRQI